MLLLFCEFILQDSSWTLFSFKAGRDIRTQSSLVFQKNINIIFIELGSKVNTVYNYSAQTQHNKVQQYGNPDMQSSFGCVGIKMGFALPFTADFMVSASFAVVQTNLFKLNNAFTVNGL